VKQKHRKKPNVWRSIALERINDLFNQAGKIFHYSKEYSNRYVTLARKISMKYKVKTPSELKKRFCKHCYSYLVPGNTSRVRIHKSKVIYYCKNCRKFMRFPIKDRR